jgi:hypothetical protein
LVNDSEMKTHPILPWLLVVCILLVLAMGQASLLTLPKVAETGGGLPLSRDISTFLTLLMLLIGVSNVVTVRWLFLPEVARRKRGTPEQIGLVSLTFAVAPSIYGAVIVVFTGQGFLTLPFSALALAGIRVIYPYLKRVIGALE